MRTTTVRVKCARVITSSAFLRYRAIAQVLAAAEPLTKVGGAGASGRRNPRKISVLGPMNAAGSATVKSEGDGNSSGASGGKVSGAVKREASGEEKGEGREDEAVEDVGGDDDEAEEGEVTMSNSMPGLKRRLSGGSDGGTGGEDVDGDAGGGSATKRIKSLLSRSSESTTSAPIIADVPK